MYTYIVQRTQIYLSEHEARTLDRLAKERGQTRSHLIREAIRETYLGGRISDEEFEAALDEAFGAWADETPEQAAERDQWLRNLRGPGLGYEIAAMRGEPMPDLDKDLSR
jgi:predicted transcriptional regulator